MKSVFRALSLRLLLGGLSCLLVRTAHAEVIHPLATIALLVLPALGVWLTASAVALLPESRFRRFGFWMLTVAGWIALLVLLQGRAESGDAERQLILLSLIHISEPT